MKNRIIATLAIGLLISAFQAPLRAADDSEEQKQISVLQSAASLTEKDQACARLRRIGTVRSVPALTALLADENLSHSARYALESMPGPEAERALISGLASTTGMTRVGIVNSLGFRAEPEAVAALIKILGDADRDSAAAAAAALGKTGGADAVNALRAALSVNNEIIHAAVVDALLACGSRLVAAGHAPEALPIFQPLYDSEKSDAIRMAAFRGVLLASGDRQLDRMGEAIAGNPGPSQIAALQLVHEIPASGATLKFVSILAKADPLAQVSLIAGLSQRKDVAAIPAIAVQVGNSEAAVRLAAIRALGDLADASAIPVLAKAAAHGSDAEQIAAQEALVQLRLGKPTDALLANLTTAEPSEQAEIARALGLRADPAALPKLLDLARNGSDAACAAAFQALALLAGPPEIEAVTKLVIDAKTAEARIQAADALAAIYQRIAAKQGKADAAPLVKAMQAGNTETKTALLRVCGTLIDPDVRQMFHVAVNDPTLRVAAVRALAQARDAALLPELEKIACEAPEKNLRVLALRGAVRMATSPEGTSLPVMKRLASLKAILDTKPAVTEKRVLLSGFSELADLQTMDVLTPLIADPDVQAEAARAAIKVAMGIADNHRKEAIACCKKVVAEVADDAIKQDAQAALKQLQAMEGFITAWQISGPYRQAGKDYAALFDTPFAPETVEVQTATWQTPSLSSDPKRPWLMDLLKNFGGEQCVAYARVWIRSETAQSAKLEIGCDDGEKVWLNGKLVFGNNASRAFNTGEDKVDVTLNAGWNPLLLKVTQNNQGWEFSVRCVKPDGTIIENLEFSTTVPQ